MSSPEANTPDKNQQLSQITRRQFLIGGIGTASLLVVSHLFDRFEPKIEPEAVATIDPELFGYYGLVAHQQLQTAYAVRDPKRKGLYYDRFPNGRALASSWSFSHAMSANIDTAGSGQAQDSHRDNVKDSINGLGYYWRSTADSGVPGYQASISGDNQRNEKYYDDNAWAGLNLVRAGRQMADQQMIDSAKLVYEFILSGVSGTDACAPGGVYWKQRSGKNQPDINTVSNAPNAQLGMRLCQLTGDGQYLDTALKMYQWANQYMRDPKDGLFWDHMGINCKIDDKKWSYNQGTMIGANLLLYDIFDQQKSYLQEAEHIANASLRHYTKDLKPDLSSQPIEFNAIYLRNLLLLSAKTEDAHLSARIQATAREYAQEVWSKFFIHNKHRTVLDSYPLIEQAAIVEILSMLGWATDKYDLLV